MEALLILLALSSGTACAQEAELLRCGEQTDKEQRLACFDALTAQVAAAKKAGATPEAKTRIFGLEGQPRRDDIEAIDSQIDGLFEGWNPGSVIRLANGQSWQVIDKAAAVVYLQSPKVKIRRAAMGTFMLELEGSRETARVRRLAP